jgi:hypothetical protein
MLRNRATHWLVIASDRRERGNLSVLEGAKNGGIASVAALPRNDAREHRGQVVQSCIVTVQDPIFSMFS